MSDVENGSATPTEPESTVIEPSTPDAGAMATPDEPVTVEATSSAHGRGVPFLLGLVAVLAVAGLVVSVIGYLDLSDDLDARDARIEELSDTLKQVQADVEVGRADLDVLTDVVTQFQSVAAGADGTSGAPGITTTQSNALPPFAGNGQPDAAIGMKMPDITGEDYLTGETLELATDRPTMVLLWAHWCPYCQAEVPIVQSLYDEGVFDDNGVTLISIATFEDASRGNPFEEWMTTLTIPVIRDDDSRSAVLGHSGVPSWVIVNPDFTVVGRVSGAFGEEGLRPLIEQVGAQAGS